MKNFTLKSILACAVMALGLTTADAQRVTFQKNSDVSNKIYETHRTVPLWADFNNDGLMDVYYGGTSAKYGWTVGGYLIKNLGDLNIENVTEYKKETVEVTDPETGAVTTQERIVGMANGLPYTANGMGSLTLDYNQDGLVDFIFTDRGGNNSGEPKGLVLVKNLGNYQFEIIKDEAIASLNWGGDESSFNEDQEVGCLSIGDYNKDGYPDLAVTGNGNNGRFVKLLKNVNGEHFEFAPVFKPLAYDVEINKLGIYKKTEASVDEEGIEVPGSYTQEPTYEAKPMSHGSIMFADFDNDGWLDIVVTGYTDGDDTDPVAGPQVGGDNIRFYRNTQDGMFQDVTDHLCAEGETLANVFARWGTEDSWLSALDFNQDGKVDIVFVGTMPYREGKQSVLLMNVYDAETGKFAFEEAPAGLTPISGTTVRLATVVDMNGDDYPDWAMRGWTSYEGWNDWRFSINYSGGSSQYTFDWFWDNEPAEIGGHFSETMSFGDLSGDGLVDMLASNWWTNGDTLCFSLNTTDAQVVAPAAPATVTAARDADNNVVVTWDASALGVSGNEPMYNLYLTEKRTGATRMIVPANKETGFQSGYAQFSAYVLSGGEEPTYTFVNVPAGDYTVGVQAVTYSYAASEFTTAEVAAYDALNKVAASDIKAIIKGNNLIVKAADMETVNVYSVDGIQVASGMANTPIQLNGKGLYLVKVGNQVIKITK